MNPEACKDVMDRSSIPYDGAQDIIKPTYHTSLDELSIRKQLPLRQQADKPILKYNTSLTKAVHLFNPEETTSYRKDVSGVGVNAYSSNGMYYTGNNNNTPTSNNILAQDATSLRSNGTQQTSQFIQNKLRRVPSPGTNPYVRPVSATEIAANVNGEKAKRIIETVAVVANVSEKSSTAGNHSTTLQRNSFLRPLSAVSVAKDKSKQAENTTDASLAKQNSSGSDCSAKCEGENKMVKDTMFQFASTTSFTPNSGQRSRQVSGVKGFKSHSPILQSQSAPLNNSLYSPKKPYSEVFSMITKGSNGDNCISATSSRAQNGVPHYMGIASAPVVQESQYTLKQLPSTNAGGVSSELNGGEPSPLKRMPVVNTLTSTVYYRKSSIPGNIYESGNESITGIGQLTARPDISSSSHQKISGTQSDTQQHQYTPSNNGREQMLAAHPPNSTTKSTAASRPAFERSYASVHLNVDKANGISTPQSMSSVRSNPQVRSRDGSVDRKAKNKSVAKTKVAFKSVGGGEGKENKCIGSVARRKRDDAKMFEQRLMGDGAPSKGRVVAEKGRKNKLERHATLDEASDDDEDDDDEDDDDEDDDGDTVSGTSPSGERLPGDGEASCDGLDDEEDDGLDQFEDNSSEGESDGYSINSTSSVGQRSDGRPVTSQSSRTAKQATPTAVDERLKSLGRPATAASAPIIKPAFRNSMFKNIPPTLNFVGEGEKTESLPWEFRKLLKWKMSPITPIVVKTTLARAGFRITKRNHDWLGCFGKHMKANCFRPLREYQKLNHFPGSFHIGRKDKLWRNLSKMQVHHGKRDFNFFPHTYVLPTDLKLLKRAWEDGNSKQKWIIKPPASARGIGIKVISKWSQIPRRKPVIVQRYLARPYLINDSKFDMRLYVYISSYDPLRIYVYDDGLTRFASCKYSSSMKSLNNKYMHLTNYSINKKNSEYMNNTDNTVCQGHKWSLKSLWNYLKKQGVNTTAVWDTVRDLVVKTIICGDAFINSMTKSNCRSRYTCHELFGFDVLLDENLKPWILEVNISPSLHSNSQLDINIKGSMIKDLMNIAGFRLPDERDVTTSGSPSDFSSHHPLNKYCMDKRLFTNQFAPDERAKHAYYCQKYQDEQIMQSILDVLTPDDVRHLCEVIDEDSRKGNFQRLFPTPSTHRYLRYFEQPRYYNLLLDQWVLRYNRMEQRGILLLQSFCDEGIHLQNPTPNHRHQWTPPNCTLSSMRSQDLRPLPNPTSARGSVSTGVAPRPLKKMITTKAPPASLTHSVSNSSVSSTTTSTMSPSPIGPLASPTR